MQHRIHQITDLIVNIYLIVEDDGLTLIDTGTRGGLKAIQRVFGKHGYRPQDVRRILITHCDPDHVGSAGALKAWTGARLYASQVEADAMQRGELSRTMRGGKVTQFLFRMSDRMMPIPVTPVDDILDDGEELPVLGGLQIIATPGHTPGHVSFFAPAHQVLFAGDSMQATKQGLRCGDSPVVWDYARARESARTQAALGATMVCCGHGPVLRGEAVVFPAEAELDTTPPASRQG